MKHRPPVQPDQRRVGRLKPVALTAAAVAAFGLTVGAALAASGFVDVADSHRASAEITAAHQVGVFQGYGDGTFRPDGKLTRGQAELVIHRMLTWQGTDDDGNFEISRADAAVLAMSGLCGLDPDRIPACAAVGADASEAEVQAAYNRGYDDGLDAATPTGSTPAEPPTGSTPAEPPTGSTPPPVTVPPFRTPKPPTGLDLCRNVFPTGWFSEWHGIHSFPGWKKYDNASTPGFGRVMLWGEMHLLEEDDGIVCVYRTLSVNLDKKRSSASFRTYCRPHSTQTVRNHSSPSIYLSGPSASYNIQLALAGTVPTNDLWPDYDPTGCLTRP